jgi:anti-sigma factor RsiW
MKHEQHHGPLEPQDVEELLPWYVTGRVSREEARGIEAALKTMPDLAGKLAQVQREREAVARASETVESAPPETLQRLLQQVETTRQWRVPKIESHSEAGGWLRAAMGRNAVWQTALAAACVAIVALSVQLYSVPAGTDASLVASAPAETDAPSVANAPSAAELKMVAGAGESEVGFAVAGNINGAPAATLLVTFQAGATAGDIGTLLTRMGARIVDGPKPGGAYVVALPSTNEAEVQAATANLLARKDLVAGVLSGQ